MLDDGKQQISHLLNNIYVPDMLGMFIVHSGSTLMIMISLPFSNANPPDSCISTSWSFVQQVQMIKTAHCSYLVGLLLAHVMREKYLITGHMQPLSTLTMLKIHFSSKDKGWASRTRSGFELIQNA